MIEFLLLVSRQGKTRLSKWYSNTSSKEKARAIREVSAMVLGRPQKQCNFIEWRDKKIVYKRYASLYFIACISKQDNELITLETIHLFVEVLDRYFGNVCELDIIFNFHKAYYIVDELFIGGELQESSKKEVLRVCSQQEDLMEESRDDNMSMRSRMNGPVMAHVQELMSSYYGIDDDTTENKHIDSASDLDSNRFNAEDYVQDMVQNNTLSEMMQKDDQLVHEIQKIESEMETLVYENYHKFIKASDTLRSVKENVNTMEVQMQKVLVAVEKITVQSTEMDSRMEGKMLDVQKVIDMRVLVKQMEKLQELPERMETLIQNGEAHEAVKVFGSEKHNFNQCREIARFADVRQRVETQLHALEEIIVDWVSKLNREQSAQLTIYCQMLMQMDVHQSAIEELYLKWHQEQSVLVLKQLPDTDVIQSKLQYLKQEFLDPMCTMMVDYGDLFELQQEAIHTVVKELTGQFFATCLHIFSNEKTNCMPQLEDLEYFTSLLVDAEKNLEGICLQDKALEVMEATVRNNIHGAFDAFKYKMQTDVVQHLSTIFNDTTKSAELNYLRNEVQVARNQVPLAIENTLQQLASLGDTCNQLLPELSLLFAGIIQDQFHASYRWFTQLIMQLSAHPFYDCMLPIDEAIEQIKNEHTDKLEMLCAMASIVHFSSLHAFESCTDALSSCMRQYNAQSVVEQGDVKSTTKTLSKCTDYVLLRYINRQGNAIADSIVCGWSKLNIGQPSPISVHEATIAAMQNLHEVAKLSSSILGEDLVLVGRNAAMRTLRRGSMNTAAMSKGSNHISAQLDIERMFAKRIKVFSAPKCTTNDIMLGICRIIFRSMLEYLRFHTFTCEVYQQLEVDVTFMGWAVCQIVRDVGDLENLLVEVNTTAYERSINPVALDRSTMANIQSKSTQGASFNM